MKDISARIGMIGYFPEAVGRPAGSVVSCRTCRHGLVQQPVVIEKALGIGQKDIALNVVSQLPDIARPAIGSQKLEIVVGKVALRQIELCKEEFQIIGGDGNDVGPALAQGGTFSGKTLMR